MRRILFAAIVTLAMGLLLAPSQAASSPTAQTYTQIVLQHVNYANSTATVWIYMAVSTPIQLQTVQVYLADNGVSYGPLTLKARGGNGTWTSFSNGNGTYITLPITGSSSFFPVDSYGLNFNFTTMLGLFSWENATNASPPYFGVAPVVAQQFSFSASSITWVHTRAGDVGEVSLSLDRKDWVAWATLGPIFLIYVMIGFLSLIPVDRQKIYNRMILQFLMFAITIGYYLTISSSVPPTPGFLPLVQVLTYVGLTSITSFMLLSVLTHVFNWRVLTADSIAIAWSVVLFDFFLFTTIFSNQMLAMTYYKLIFLQLGATISLIAGTIIALAKWTWDDKFIEAGKSLLIFPMGPPQDSVVNWFFGMGLTLNFGALLLTTYVVQILNPSVELTPLHRLIYQYTEGNFLLSGAANFAVNIALFVAAYVILKKRSRLLWAAVGILVFIASLYDFINDSSLVPSALGPLFNIALPVAFVVIVWIFSLAYNGTIKERVRRKSLKSGGTSA